MTPQVQQINLNVTIQEAEYILGKLGQSSWNEVNNLMVKLVNQIQQQAQQNSDGQAKDPSTPPGDE